MYGLQCDYADGFQAGREAEARERAEREVSVFKARIDLIGNLGFYTLLFLLGMWLGLSTEPAQKADKIEQMSVRVK